MENLEGDGKPRPGLSITSIMGKKAVVETLCVTNQDEDPDLMCSDVMKNYNILFPKHYLLVRVNYHKLKTSADKLKLIDKIISTFRFE